MDSQLARLCDAYFRSWMAADPFTATEFGVTGYDAEVPDPSREADSARIAELERLGAEVARLDPATLTPDERVSRSMLLRLAADEREELGGRLDELAVTATSVGAPTRRTTRCCAPSRPRGWTPRPGGPRPPRSSARWCGRRWAATAARSPRSWRRPPATTTTPESSTSRVVWAPTTPPCASTPPPTWRPR